MSFTEEQVRKIVRDELRKIIDTGLMYNQDAPATKPEAKPLTESTQRVNAKLTKITWEKRFNKEDEPYEIAEPEKNKTEEFSYLQSDIQAVIAEGKKGRMFEGMWYWLFESGAVGRKESKYLKGGKKQ